MFTYININMFVNACYSETDNDRDCYATGEDNFQNLIFFFTFTLIFK